VAGQPDPADLHPVTSPAASARPSLILRRLPALASLRDYSRAAARGDLVAGITVATVAVPQAMAYALIAGLPVQIGLYTAIVMTAVGALFDSSRLLINGPTNAISIAVLSAIALVPPEQRVEAAILLALLVGAIQLAITLLRLGDLERYISHSVIVGFTLGAGTLLVLDQIKNLIGFAAIGAGHEHFLLRLWGTLSAGDVHGPTAAIGLGSIGSIVALRFAKRRLGWPLLPDLLLTVVLMGWLTAQLGLDAQGVRVVGEIPRALPGFEVPRVDPDLARQLAGGALAIAVLGLLEAISMAKAIAARSPQKLDMNQQCLSEAVANLTGSFFHCLPGSGSLTRSAINRQAGAASQWSGVVSAATVALIILVFAPWARFIPRAALAGILMVSAFNMVDWRALAYHVRTTRFDAAIVAATAFSAVAISIEFCVMIGVLMSFLLTVPRAGRMLLTEFVIGRRGVQERLPGDPACEQILVFGLEGELFFGATAALEEHFARIEERVTPRTAVVVLRLKRARNPDAVGLTQLEQFVERMHARSVTVLLCGVRPDLARRLDRSGLSAKLGNDLFLEQPVRLTSTALAMRRAYQLIPGPCEICPHRAALMSQRAST
jgi:SulP family sulfate permease